MPRDLLHRGPLTVLAMPSAQPSLAIPRDNQRELVMNAIRRVDRLIASLAARSAGLTWAVSHCAYVRTGCGDKG